MIISVSDANSTACSLALTASCRCAYKSYLIDALADCTSEIGFFADMMQLFVLNLMTKTEKQITIFVFDFLPKQVTVFSGFVQIHTLKDKQIHSKSQQN